MAFRSFFTGAAFRAVSRSVLQCSQRTAVGLGSMTVVSSSARFSAIAPQGVRYLSTVASQSNQQSYKFGTALGISASLLLGWATTQTFAAAEKKADWNQIKNEILAVLENDDYDDGSYAPVLIRLAWHAAGTYDGINSKSGGSNGATMRWAPEASHGANAGLDVARALLEPIKKRHPEISYADLWTFAGVVAVEAMGGPKVPWRPGRSDAADHRSAPPDGRLPDANRGFDHIRAIFYRMGLNDREIVALLGAHAVGRCHTNRSGFDGPWTNSPTVFTNEFYVQLLTNTWTKRNWKGPTQFEDKDKQLMMLPSDMSLLEDPEFRKYVELYAKDQDQFFKDFASAFSKLLELGVPAFQK